MLQTNRPASGNAGLFGFCKSMVKISYLYKSGGSKKILFLGLTELKKAV
jgi:hypothetical protein